MSGNFVFEIDGKPAELPKGATVNFDGKPDTGTVILNGVERIVVDGVVQPQEEKK